MSWSSSKGRHNDVVVSCKIVSSFSLMWVWMYTNNKYVGQKYDYCRMLTRILSGNIPAALGTSSPELFSLMLIQSLFFRPFLSSDLPSEVNPECASTSQFFPTHHMFIQGRNPSWMPNPTSGWVVLIFHPPSLPVCGEYPRRHPLNLCSKVPMFSTYQAQCIAKSLTTVD